jgi:hypothetical protein
MKTDEKILTFTGTPAHISDTANAVEFLNRLGGLGVETPEGVGLGEFALDSEIPCYEVKSRFAGKIYRCGNQSHVNVLVAGLHYLESGLDKIEKNFASVHDAHRFKNLVFSDRFKNFLYHGLEIKKTEFDRITFSFNMANHVYQSGIYIFEAGASKEQKILCDTNCLVIDTEIQSLYDMVKNHTSPDMWRCGFRNIFDSCEFRFNGNFTTVSAKDLTGDGNELRYFNILDQAYNKNLEQFLNEVFEKYKQ